MLGKELLLVNTKKAISENFFLSSYGSLDITFRDANGYEDMLYAGNMNPQGYTVVFPVTILEPSASDTVSINTFSTCNYTVNARDQIVITPIDGKVAEIEIGTPW
nr:MAG TPA: hypothetical protein [Caudoviricetes sp.]